MKSKAITTIMITLFLASMLTMAFVAPAAATPDSGIVGLWHFDEGEDINAYDSSGYDNHGTISDVAMWTEDGKFGPYALDFDGDDYVDLGYRPIFDFDQTTSKFTGELWIKAESWPSDVRVIGKYNVDQNNRAWSFGFQDAKPFIILSEDGTWSTTTVVWYWADDALNINQWYHIAYTVDVENDDFNIYVNGDLVPASHHFTKTTIDDIYNGDAKVFIGAYQNGDTQGGYFDGLIDEVRIWNQALTLKQIEASFTGVTTAILYLEKDLKAEIDALPPEDFKPPAANRKVALIHKIDEVIAKIVAGEYKDAIMKLLKDIKPKLDSGAKQAWLVEPHPELLIKIAAVVGILEGML